MGAKEKAVELVEKYKDYVHGYVGSSMLTNYEYPDQILSQAKKCALITTTELKNNCFANHELEFWQDVEKEIEKYNNE